MTRLLQTLLLSASLLPHATMAGKGPGNGAPKSICLLGADFGSGIPAGWSVGAPVEQQDELGNGLGTFVDAWTTGTSATARVNGYFPVPDIPSGNSFAMANDDATPCNCAMNDVALTSPVIDLSGVQNAAMRFRAFNNGAFGGGDGVVEASGDGNTWTAVATIGAIPHVWQWFQADLSAFDGSSAVRVRIRWSDNGGWAGGLAIDDICVNARPAHDLVLLDAFLSDAQVTAFDGTRRTLGYTQLPVEQADTLVVKIVVFNSGSLAAINATCSVTISLNGTAQGTFTVTVPAIGAGGTDTLFINTGWLPMAPGDLEATFMITALSVDEAPSDNTAIRSLYLTGTGLDQGNNAMALDDSTVTGSIFNEGEDYAVAVRLEPTRPGSLAYAVGFLPGEGCFANGRLVGKLLDQQFNLLASSLEHALTQVEIDDALTKGTMVYLPFILPHALDGEADVYAVIEHESDSGAVTVALGQAATHGSAMFFDGPGVDWDYLLNVPMVRLYLSTPEVGVVEVPERQLSLRIAPNPASQVAVVQVEGSFGTQDWAVMDLRGRIVLNGRSSSPRFEVPVSQLAPGSYVLQVRSGGSVRAGRLMVAR
jgi:hypothetical protein